MALKETYIATVQIVINPAVADIQSESEACDWFSGLLTENEQILDWSYLKIGSQFLSPKEIFVDPEKYEEGSACG